MSEDSTVYTKDQLEDLDRKIHYMIHGQGFVVCVIDPKPTRRRTLVNILKNIGVENIAEAESYEKTMVALAKFPNERIMLITDLEVGKVNGLRIVTTLMMKYKGLCGIILVDSINPKLEQLSKVTKAIQVLKRPVDGDMLVKSMEDFGFSLQKP